MNWRWRRSRRTRWSVRMRRPWSIAVLRPLGCSTSRLRWWSGSETASYLISSETLEGEHAIHFSLLFTSVSINPAGRPSVRLISGRVALSARRISDSRKKQLDQLWTSWLNRHKFGWTCLARGSRDSINKMTFAFEVVPVNFWNLNFILILLNYSIIF